MLLHIWSFYWGWFHFLPLGASPEGTPTCPTIQWTKWDFLWELLWPISQTPLGLWLPTTMARPLVLQGIYPSYKVRCQSPISDFTSPLYSISFEYWFLLHRQSFKCWQKTSIESATTYLGLGSGLAFVWAKLPESRRWYLIRTVVMTC